MNATPDDQLRLLDLQTVDAARLQARRDELAAEIVLAETEDSDIAREQSKAEADVDQVRTRAARDQQRLDSGAVGSAKELESLQHEIGSLARRQSDLEDAVLEVMERREQVQQHLEALRIEAGKIAEELADVERRRDEQLALLDAQMAEAHAQRLELLPRIADDLLALYDKIRASSGGVGAAALHRGRCEGCHLELTNADLNALRAAEPDEVVRCEECRRILVRTAESGL